MPSAEELLQPYRTRIELALAAACEFSAGCPPRLSEAIAYALLAPGKRLRPALVMMAAEAVGGAIDAVLPAAVAVEMIHAYSLIHDDLPAMDDDDLRRGRPTTHIAYDEATAILAGDALQAEAFAHIYTHVADRSLAARLMGELAMASGASGLVGGQADDLMAEKIDVFNFGSPRDARLHVESIHRRKTGALFVACARMGGIAADGSEAQVEALGQFAAAFGLAFQITDDVLDFTASADQLGKRTGKDSDRGKWTFPHLMAMESVASKLTSTETTGTEFQRQTGERVELNVSVVPSASGLSTEINVGIERAQRQAADLIADAHRALELFGEPASRLGALADYILERTT